MYRLSQEEARTVDTVEIRLPKLHTPSPTKFSSPHSTPTFPLRWHLILLVVGCLLPLLLFAATVVHHLSQKERASAEERLLMAARGVSADVEHELNSTSRILRALAESEALDSGDLWAFHLQSKRIARTQATWMTVLLLSPDGRQLVNSAVEFGTPLPRVNEPKSLQLLLKDRRPTVGDLAAGRRGGRLAFPVRVPVLRNGELRYVLTAVIDPKSLKTVVVSQTPTTGEWTRSVVDSRGVILARSREPEKFLGKRATENYLKRIKNGEEGLFLSTTLDGVHVRTGFCRLSTAPWTASVSVPVHILEAPARRAMLLIIGIGSGLLLISGMAALLLSRRIAFPMASATEAAQSMVRGEEVSVEHGSIHEVAVLAEALEASSELLAQREKERNQHLAHAEAARDEAENANRLKDYFLAALSHELRSPLTPILGLASLLRTQPIEEEIRIYSLESIERNARALDRLVDDLLDISRLKTGKLSLEMKYVQLAEVISQGVLGVRASAEAKAIDLRVNIESTGVIYGDADRLQQIVFNLLSNAVKFTPENGVVEVHLTEVQPTPELSAEASASWAVLQVRDTGIGIGSEFLPYVFDRFRQADGSSTRKFGGLGLGLAIVRDLVELHGGTIEARSDGDGMGALFEVRLPLHKQVAAVDLPEN